MLETVKNNFANITKGVGISIIFTMIMLFIFSILLTYTDISENWIKPVIIVLTSISILIGSTIGNIKLNKNGILNGAIIGGTYIVSLYFISSCINMDFSINGQMMIIVFFGLLCGICGGIIGVNKK